MEKDRPMKRILALILVATLPTLAADISPGLSIGTGANQIQDGQRLTSAKLLQLVSDATIQTAFYTGKVGQSNLVGSDTILVVSGSSGTFHKLTGNQALLQNYHLITDQSVYSTLGGYATFLLYDPTNGVFGQINLSNLLNGGAQFVTVSNLVWMANGTNNLRAPGTTPDPTSTNLQPYFLMWTANSGTGGRALPFSNLLNSAAGYIGTNLEPKYVFAQMFIPSSFYYTNSLTNIWGFTNIVPITNLYFGTNTLLFTNNQTVQALTNTDTLPIRSVKQGNTNTTVTLEALQQWLLTNAPAPTVYQATNGSTLAAGTFTFNHAFGFTPTDVRAVFLCVSNQTPWVEGDELSFANVFDNGGSAPRVGCWANSSNVVVGLYATGLRVATGTSTFTDLTAARWKIKVIAKP